MKNLSEYEIQCKLVKYLEFLQKKDKIVLFTAIPNSTFSGIIQRVKNKKMGVRAGVPDLFILGHNHSLWLEIKREKDGMLSYEQQIWISALNTNGEPAQVAYGYQEAKEVIDDIFKII